MSTSLPRLYVKTGCPWCAEAIQVLEENGVRYDQRNVTTDRSAYTEMVKLSGQTKAPTLDWNGEILADFGAAELRPFLKQRGALR
ncbi:glutaredoxin 3 [mine drainage metagenome]|uniref:Glutaredoxin 3 n=1 Tax=mine drainage metagenome TaxID=410659 RepID=A0A1J5S3J2_9ZZZZ